MILIRVMLQGGILIGRLISNAFLAVCIIVAILVQLIVPRLRRFTDRDLEEEDTLHGLFCTNVDPRNRERLAEARRRAVLALRAEARTVAGAMPMAEKLRWERQRLIELMNIDNATDMLQYWNRDRVASHMPSSRRIGHERGAAHAVLEVWSTVLPARIARENLGDYLEDVSRRRREGQASWMIALRAIAAVFWTGIDAVSYLLVSIRRRKST